MKFMTQVRIIYHAWRQVTFFNDQEKPIQCAYWSGGMKIVQSHFKGQVASTARLQARAPRLSFQTIEGRATANPPISI